MAKIATVNVIGTSPFSSVGNGAVLINGPSAPQNVAENRGQTTSYTIGLVWNVVEDNGGTPVIDYAVWSDQSTGNYI